MGGKDFSCSSGRRKKYPLRLCSLGSALFLLGALFAFSNDSSPAIAENGWLQSLRIDCYFDPALSYLKATVRMSLAGAASEQLLWLAEGLQLNSVSNGSLPAADFNRDSGQFLLPVQGENDWELIYSGRLSPDQDSFKSAWKPDIPKTRVPVDDCYLLAYSKELLPQPLPDFTHLDFNLSVPSEWNCLGSGILRSVQSGPIAKTYFYEDGGSKYMSFVFGRFIQIGWVNAWIPIRLHGWPGFQYGNYFTEADIARVLTFYRGRFGDLDLPELNVLFRGGRYFSGNSYNGLMVLNVDESWNRLSLKDRKKIQGGSLLALSDAKTDLLAHEMAHQWWGGLISWKTPADNWLTEGLATYSTLIYLRAWQGEKTYRKILERLRQQVKKHAKSGVPADGFKLKLINRDLKLYQTMVYVKPALMLTALADRIGEGELCIRLRTMLRERHRRVLDSAEFLSLISAGDNELNVLLRRWICSWEMPDIL